MFFELRDSEELLLQEEGNVFRGRSPERQPKAILLTL